MLGGYKVGMDKSWKLEIEEELKTITLEIVERLVRKGEVDPHLFQKFKRKLADKIVKFILETLGVENVRGIYYADLIGGAEASLGVGRDLDLIIWVEREFPIDSTILEYKLNQAIFKSFREVLNVDLKDIIGPNVVEVHLVRDLHREPLGRLTLTSSTVIPIWLREDSRIQTF